MAPAASRCADRAWPRHLPRSGCPGRAALAGSPRARLPKIRIAGPLGREAPAQWTLCQRRGQHFPGVRLQPGPALQTSPSENACHSPRSVTRSYYRGAAGALLVYDITSRETYNALTNWLTDARMLASQSIVVILCGNKKDLDADREVTFLEASSALTGESVEDAFVQCARKILNKIESGELDPERMGSGIQYGDAALRQLRSPRRAQAPSAQDCGC
ncbi:Ras-related protein Rab-4A [Pteropus alecto]|uniref:Ras-related protein Rab-4A n=1 Tax=Pteropus alecto TaxID=9402 RepID=L5K0E7_PTEAL|nr:Ras-related protein Rab-4A [Pteropus alecto]